jgi:hypothetical protein
MFSIYIKTFAVICPLQLCPNPLSLRTVIVISDGSHWCLYITVGGHISPESEKVNIAVKDAFGGSVSTSYTFLSPWLTKLEIMLGSLIHHH